MRLSVLYSRKKTPVKLSLPVQTRTLVGREEEEFSPLSLLSFLLPPQDGLATLLSQCGSRSSSNTQKNHAGMRACALSFALSPPPPPPPPPFLGNSQCRHALQSLPNKRPGRTSSHSHQKSQKRKEGGAKGNGGKKETELESVSLFMRLFVRVKRLDCLDLRHALFLRLLL